MPSVLGHKLSSFQESLQIARAQQERQRDAASTTDTSVVHSLWLQHFTGHLMGRRQCYLADR